MISASRAKEKSDEHVDFKSAVTMVESVIDRAITEGKYTAEFITFNTKVKSRMISYLHELGYQTNENMGGRLFIYWSK